jgi:3-deoxy-D-manno-octulosonic-acid transferase
LSSLIYNISIYLYQFIIWVVSPFNKKAKLWIEGRSDFRFTNTINPKPEIAWFHCASLGEFEQGRPVIEKFRETFPEYKILLTFFSPSGYEVRKNYAGADFICYLPSDTPANAKEFIEYFNPSIAFFVKYEFWYNYLRVLHEKQIPVISFSAIFRENQIFFKWYGGFQRDILKYFTHIFVQNKASLDLLQSIDIQNVTVNGDTRFDRVADIVRKARIHVAVNSFKADKPLLIVGSCWQEDFEVIAPFLNNFTKDLKVIIAPHEINEQEIERWAKVLNGTTIKYSDLYEIGFDYEKPFEYKTLIIDNIGILSSLYRHADFAWIGGAYGKGLHNILEAATFGMPIFFGNKNYQKFQEATDLQKLLGARAVGNTEEFAEVFQTFYNDKSLRNHISGIVRNYVEDNLGATDKVIKYVNELQIFDSGLRI